MITFILSLAALVLGYIFYGRFVERVFGPDDRVTPAVSKADGLDYIVMPGWKIFMIQFLNIAGTGPIFGAIMGAKFGPAAYLWIVFGCIFAGAVHDYLGGMLSMRHDGAGLPEMIGHYLGTATKNVMLVVSVLLLILVGAVFVYSPALILHSIGGDTMMWVIIIFCYYFIATMLPIDKIIGKVYPLFALSLLFMAGALMVWLIFHWPAARTVDALLQHGGCDGARSVDRQHLPRAVHHRRLRCHLWLPRHAEPADGPLRRERTHGTAAVLRGDDYRGGRGADMGHGVDMVFMASPRPAMSLSPELPMASTPLRQQWSISCATTGSVWQVPSWPCSAWWQLPSPPATLPCALPV